MIQSIQRLLNKIIGITPEDQITDAITKAKAQGLDNTIISPESVNLSIEDFNKGLVWLFCNSNLNYKLLSGNRVILYFV